MIFRLLAAASLALAATPAAAQNFSEGYQFLKAVRDGDGGNVNKFLQDKSLRIVNTKERGTGEGALHIVAEKQNALYLRALLQHPDINPNLQDARGNTALLVAIDRGWTEGVTILIRYRANVNLANSAGETPLIRAVQLHNEDAVRQLLAAGANPDKADFGSGKSARDYAREFSRWPAIAKMLADAPKGGAKAGATAGPKL